MAAYLSNIATVAEVMSLLRPPPISWGNWLYCGAQQTLTHCRAGYEIDVEQLTSAEHVLDTLCQVCKKTWCTSEDAGNLLYAVEAILRPQVRLCTGSACMPACAA